jgi:hypothetical protein
MAAPKTVLTYPLNGAQKDFPIPFEYLARKFVVVTLIGKTRQVLTLNSDYRFTARTAITTTKAWGPGDLFTSIELRRVTSATERLVDFADGSILRAYDLNTSQVQSLHIAEEARDLTADTIGVNNDGDLDARGRKIVNVADGVLDGDAVNMGQNRRWSESALNQANRSEQQANLANSARINAENAQINAQTAAGQSAGARDIALDAANRSAHSQDISFQAMVRSEAARDRSETAAVNSQNSNVNSTNQADRATREADRAKVEADKLGNGNAFMGTLSKVEGLKPYWKDGGQFYERVGFKRGGVAESAYADQVELVHGSAGRFALYDGQRGMSRWYSDTSGNFVTYGAIYAQGVYSQTGSLFSVAPADSANSHYWFEGPSGNRGVIYAGIDQIIRFRAGTSNVGLSVNPNGDISVGRNVALGASYIESDGNITSSWLRGGTLRSALQNVASGTRIKNVPTVIWERGVDTAGGVGDQGAPGSQLVLRESLLPGDFYMMEVYGGAKFYSTTNCIPFGDSSTEEHNIQFDAGGSMLFRLTENGRRVTVTAGKPGNQYGIRRVFLFKLQLA